VVGTTVDKDLLACSRRVDSDHRHGEHVMDLCDVLFAQTPHLHGLTKSSRQLLHGAALLHDLARGRPEHARAAAERIVKLTDLPLTASQRRIVAEAVSLHARTSAVPVPGRGAAGGREVAMAGVAVRIAAILRIADGLDHARAQAAQIAAVADDGTGVEIVITGGPAAAGDAYWALTKADLWNRVALRPVRSVSMTRGAPPPARLVRPTDPAPEAARRFLQRQVEKLISLAYGIEYTDDIEYVHEMRVATRRLRAAMRTFRGAVRGGFAGDLAGMKTLADTLGEARDADVFVAFLRACARGARPEHQGFLKALVRSEQRRRRRRYRALAQMCASGPYRRLTRRLYRRLCLPVGAPRGIQPAKKRSAGSVRQTARRAMRKRLGQLKGFGRRLDALTLPQQHALRIACKKLRYTAELFAEIYPPQMAKLIAAMVKMQDLLGDVHDADVYAQRVAGHVRASRSPSTARGASEACDALVDRLRSQQVPLLARARRAWLAFTSPRTQKRVVELIDSPRKV